MRLVVLSGIISVLTVFIGTPLLIKFLLKHGYSQAIRVSTDNEPYPEHEGKRGTPSMGGAAIVVAIVLGYGLTHLIWWAPPSPSALLVLRFPDDRGITPATQAVSLIRDTAIVLPLGLFLLWIWFLVTATTNGVNLTDGLDGLVSGAATMTFAAYTLMSVWQFGQRCSAQASAVCYDVRDPFDMAVFAAAFAGACFGFLWWNTSPAQIFMGDTGSLSIGGAIAALAVLTHTQLLLALLAGLFVLVTLSVIAQVGSFKLTGKRVLRMAPLHHHFELLGWQEITIVVRFWLIQGVVVALGMALFYAEWVRQ